MTTAASPFVDPTRGVDFGALFLFELLGQPLLTSNALSPLPGFGADAGEAAAESASASSAGSSRSESAGASALDHVLSVPHAVAQAVGSLTSGDLLPAWLLGVPLVVLFALLALVAVGATRSRRAARA